MLEFFEMRSRCIFAFCMRMIFVSSNSHCWISKEPFMKDANGLESSNDCSRFLWRSCGRSMLSPHILRRREKISLFFWIIYLPTMFGVTRPGCSSTLSNTPSMEGVTLERKLSFCWTPFANQAKKKLIIINSTFYKSPLFDIWISIKLVIVQDSKRHQKLDNVPDQRQKT